MTIVLTGGGSGGHITPLQAVAAEIKRRNSAIKLIYIGQKGDKLGDIPANDPNIDEVYGVRAGKFRRYHGEGLKQLLHIPAMLLNIRDFFYVIIGTFQSRRLLKRLQPGAIFIKGGFVGVPVGLAAAQLHIPYITHDSDAIPGLANKIIARWAALHAVALPVETYHYPAAKTIMTGIPLQADFVPMTPTLHKRYRQELKLPEKARVLFIIGGGQGAQRINQAVSEAVPYLLQEYRDLYVIHSAGRANQEAVEAAYAERLNKAEQGRLRVAGYIDDVYRHSGAADLIITRAGATNLAEFAQQGRACIVVPAPFLAGGHQTKNADFLAKKHAAAILDEEELTADPNRLAKLASDLLSNDKRRQQLATNLAEFAHPGAATELAQLIIEHAK